MNIECPYCKADFTVPPHVQVNVHSYSGTATISTVCCNQPVRVKAVKLCAVTAIPQTKSVADDWGNEFNPNRLVPVHDQWEMVD